MKKIYFLAVLFISMANVYGQKDSSAYKYWLNFGLGINKSSVANFGGSYNFSYKNNFYQVGYQNISRELNYVSQDFAFKEFYLKAVNVGFGYVTANEYFLFSNFIGPSFDWGNEPSEDLDIYGIHKINKFSTFGIALNSQIFFRLISEIGIGMELYGNWNPKRTMAEVRVSINLNNRL